MWSTTGAAGDIIGLSVATHVLERSGGVGSHVERGETTEQWTNVFWAIAIYLAAVSVLLAVGVEDRAWMGLNKKREDEAKAADETAPLLPDGKGKGGAKGKKSDAAREHHRRLLGLERGVVRPWGAGLVHVLLLHQDGDVHHPVLDAVLPHPHLIQPSRGG
jgi:hypothetical protein